MNSQEFAYWLNGFFELSESKKLSEKQVEIIKDHLKLVFTKITPNHNIMVPFDKLTDIGPHHGLSPWSPPPGYPGVTWPPGYPGVIPGINPLDITCKIESGGGPDKPDYSSATDAIKYITKPKI